MRNIKSFENVIFPEDVSWGAASTIIFNNDVIVVESGYEKRIVNWTVAKHEFNVSHTVKNHEQAEKINELYYSMLGRATSFKFKNWIDYQVEKRKGIANIDGVLTGLPYVDLFKKYHYSEQMENFYSKRIKLIATDNEVERIFFNCYIDDVEVQNYDLRELEGRVFLPFLSRIEILDISKELNGKVTTSTNHDFKNGDKIYISGGFSSLINNRLFTITKIDDTNFLLNFDTTNLSGNTSGFAFLYPQSGVFSWEGEYFHKVRFAEDMATTTIDNLDSFSFPCNLIEVEE